jgi:flagellar export protein FliJ
MKKFAFSLERVREIRMRQAEEEEIRLERLLAERAAAHAAIARLDEERESARAALSADSAIESQDLAARDEYRSLLLAKRKELLDRQSGCQNRIAAQTQVVLEARRKVRLLDKLRRRRLGEWTAELERELEALAAESFLARRQRESAAHAWETDWRTGEAH